MIIAQAVGASRDCSGPTCEGLIVEAAVQNRLIEVLPGQGDPAELEIICISPTEAPRNSAQIERFWCFLREAGN